MQTRRTFLYGSALAAGWNSIRPASALAADADFPSRRPPASQRKFVSESIEAKISEVKAAMTDRELAWLFENCFPNTLDTTVRPSSLDGQPDTFVITGDIDAMWLRDSSAQVWPYLPFTKEDPKLKALIAGVIRRQTRCILIDPYANAFNFGPTGSEFDSDLTHMRPELHERKWEIDSLCYPVRLAHGYWKATGDGSCFDAHWKGAAALTVATFREQQRMHSHGPYSFQRRTANPTDTLPLHGFGNPTRPCGLIHSGFRPSDDACIYPFLIPSNLFAVVSLRQLAEIHSSELSNPGFAAECRTLADQVEEAIRTHAKAHHARFGEIYAYEVDGYGNQLVMDDANVPSLLSLPYLGCCAVDDPLYRRTRDRVLSDSNPYFFRGPAGEGIGGPHAGLGMIWPLGIVMRALTSNEDAEIVKCLDMLKHSHAGTGMMHESFSQADAAKYTRAWFAWANTLFGELILTLYSQRRKLVA
jgi:meiotically up-regulated gene 157 (Mug157) protein